MQTSGWRSSKSGYNSFLYENIYILSGLGSLLASDVETKECFTTFSDEHGGMNRKWDAICKAVCISSLLTGLSGEELEKDTQFLMKGYLTFSFLYEKNHL